MSDALDPVLATGATVVTPNRRLARHLVEAFDRRQREAGARSWASAHALPWPSFTAELEQEAVAAGAIEPGARLSELAVAESWRAIVETDGVSTLDPGALARLGSEAWDLVHAFGSGGESWRAWAGGVDEPSVFARWAERYRSLLEARRASDAATAPDRLARADAGKAGWRGRRIVFAGFLELTPQQRRLAEALRRAGASVEEVPTLNAREAEPQRATYASPDDELCAALAWARRDVEAREGSRIGIVVPDLAGRRAWVRLRAIDILGLPDEDDGSAAWNLSLGPPIAEAPLVACAMDLVSLAWSRLPVGRAAAWLRSAFLPGAAGAALGRRAEIERAWLERAVSSVGLSEVVGELGRRHDDLASRLASGLDAARRLRRGTRRQWVDAWRALLASAGWPGDRALSSAEHQASAALDGHFAAFAALDATSPAQGGASLLAADAAIAAFGEILVSAPFQPEAAPAPIQILGLYEAVGLPFDALWIAGMNDETLPRAPRPHPFLPVAWQRERGVPRSDASRELAFARDVASMLLRAAPKVVVSHARSVDDRPALPSEAFPRGTDSDEPVPARPAQVMFAGRPRLEHIVDAAAPVLVPGERVSKGSGLIAAQSDCPFQALASRRWHADPWPGPGIGLTAMERGSLVHAALAAFWRAIGDHASLVERQADATAFMQARRDASEAAIATIDAARWRRLPAVVQANEADRLARALGEWLAVEARRAPFTVIEVEHEMTLALVPLDLALRVDRVDRLADGGVAILDYKTGAVPGPARWTSDRPEATQMALYTLAWRDAHRGDAVRAAVLARVKPGEAKAIGLYADEGARLGPPPERDDRAVVDWAATESRWDELMRGLAASFAGGDAQVAPRSAAICRTCARQSLCRVGGTVADEDEAGS